MFSLLLALPAYAAPPPVLLPTRDVTIDYRVQPPGQRALDVTVEALAGGDRLRLTSPDLPTVILVDRPAARATVMLPLLRLFTVVKIGTIDPERTILRGAVFTPVGPGHAAGLPCTEWRARSADGEAAGCLTADGVLLRGTARSARRGALGALEATRVAYGPLDAGEFAIPNKYHEAPFKLGPSGLPE